MDFKLVLSVSPSLKKGNIMMYVNEFVGAIKVDGKILREIKPGEVIIPFGREYSVYFKNLSSKRASVKVSIDGEDVLSGRSLVVGSNDSVDLERFFNTKNKFKFIKMTDKIADNRGVKAEDGIVRIEWQFESNYISTWTNSGWGYNYPSGPGYMCRDFTANYSDGTALRGLGSTKVGSNSVMDTCFASCGEVSTAGGFTTKGSESNQQFNQGYIGPLEVQKYSMCFYLRGKDTDMLFTVKDLISCSICGTKNKYQAKYCTECGTYISIM